MQVVLSSWTEADFGCVAALEKRCFADAWTEEQLSGAFHRVDFYGKTLSVDGKIEGYLCATQLFEEAELLNIAVSPERRGNGYGGALLDDFLREMRSRGVERVYLEVRLSNVAARSLYEKRGFTQTRVRDKYYADGESALEMVKTL